MVSADLSDHANNWNSTVHTKKIPYQKNRQSPVKFMLPVTLVRYVPSNLTGERYFRYRYRVQCDRGFNVLLVSGITSYMWLQRPSETDMKANPAGTQSISIYTVMIV